MYQGTSIPRKRNPRETTGFLRFLTFLYTTEIFKRSTHRDLIEDDIYEPLPDCETQRIGDRLEHEWLKEVQLGRNSLSRALMRTFGRTYFMLGIFAFIVKTSLTTANPLLMGRFIKYFENGSEITQEEACLYGGMLIISGLIQSAFNHHYHLLMSILGIKIKASLASLIYRKSLRMTSAALMEVTSGKLVTLINKDACSFEMAINFFHDLWIGIAQLIVITYVMYRQIEEATFVGIGLLFALIPIQVYVAKFTKTTRLKTAAKTDERLKRMQEILTSIRLLKLYNWADYYTKLTNKLRTEEMKKLRLIFYLKAIVLVISQLSQRLSFYLCILYYISLGNMVTAEKVFVVITCYGSLRFVLTIAIPMCVSQFAEARSAMKRIKHCLLAQEVESLPCSAAVPKINIQTAAIFHCKTAILKNVNFNTSGKALIAIAGNVGSGKSTFLKMLLNEIRPESGIVQVDGVCSYASQEPWLFPGTIKQNILFGETYDNDRYQEVLRCCALVTDLERFSMKDNTVVTDKGVNLSKGQQARINLARAIYKIADIYLLDDVMVSLDATVSKHIFQQCLQGFLKNNLVLFVCNNKKYLKETDRIIYMQQGHIEMDASYEELVAKGAEFATESINACFESTEESVTNKVNSESNNEEDALLQTMKEPGAPKLYSETQEQGKVQLKVYKSYVVAAGGWKILIFVVVLFSIAQIFTSYFDYYVSNWLKIEEELSSLIYNISEGIGNITMESKEYIAAEEAHTNSIFIYSFLIGISVLSVTTQLFSFFSITSRASNNLHNTVFSRITSATMTFFDKYLAGNILNRFSKDMTTIDEYLPYVFYETARVAFFTIGITSVITAVRPLLLIPTSIMLVVMVMTRKYFLNASRGLKRLDGMTRAPVIGYLNSSIEGLATIRASGNQALLTKQFERHQDINTSTLFMYFSISRAYGLWLDIICKVYVTVIIYTFIFFTDRGGGNAGKVGVALTQSLGFMGLLQWGIRQWSELENQMTCVERITEYSDVEQEKQTGQDPDNWPLKGQIEYRNVCLSYFTGQPILKNVNFTIKSGERVGVVGRTGAGKSSLISALFRLYKIQGSIIIDDYDIRDIELSIIRSKISIIPQDPVLFAGTIRSNLDPENNFTDLQLWNVLGEVELKYDVENLKEGLNTEVAEGGGNFSIGQRQLVCLARAALRDNKILVLDEATANIDPQTDALIQKTIKRLFTHCTILTIAHRLHTVIDSDRIIVVDNGEVVDFEKPEMLIDRRKGIFYTMACQAGLAK